MLSLEQKQYTFTFRAFNNAYKYGIIRISKTSLDSSADRNNLTIPGYGLIRADRPPQ